MPRTAQSIADARSTILRESRYSSQVVRVGCTVCGVLPRHRTITAAVDHARLSPGHVVTVQTLQSTTFAVPVLDHPKEG